VKADKKLYPVTICFFSFAAVKSYFNGGFHLFSLITILALFFSLIAVHIISIIEYHENNEVKQCALILSGYWLNEH